MRVAELRSRLYHTPSGDEVRVQLVDPDGEKLNGRGELAITFQGGEVVFQMTWDPQADYQDVEPNLSTGGRTNPEGGYTP